MAGLARRRLSILALMLALGPTAPGLAAPAPAGAAPGLRALGSQGAALEGPRSLVASPDGRSLYAVSPDDDAVLSFRTNPLRFQGCFSANARVRPRFEPRRRGGEKPPRPIVLPPCRTLPGTGTEDGVSGFNGVRFATISPDGRSVYTVSTDDDSIGIFARKPSGRLGYKGCITGSTAANSSGKRRICRTIPTATPVHEGVHSGLGGPVSLTVSPDGRFAYVAARADAAIATFAREPNGLLSYRGCLTGGISLVVTGHSSPCTQVAAQNWHSSGLRSVARIAISPDGRSLYASAPRAAAVAEFGRDPSTGQLTYRGCLTGESRGLEPTNPCRPVPTAQEAGFDSGLWLLDDLAISGDGRNLYGLARGDNAVAAFERDPVSGALTFLDGEGAGERPRDLVLSPSGRSVYVAGREATVLRLRRDPGAGTLSFASVSPLPFGGASSLAIAGRTLYAAAARQSQIARFAITGG